MALDKITPLLDRHVDELVAKGIAKGQELVITRTLPPADGYSVRYQLAGFGERPFLKMNSNAYLGLGLDAAVLAAEARAAEDYGAGPGAVRFISGTYAPHVALEQALAAFHGREAAMVLSAAYASVMGVLPQFITEDTLVLSDALNHNSIINAIRLSRPAAKAVYRHLDMAELAAALAAHKGRVRRVCLVTDGIFSMRGDYAPLDRIMAICREHEADYPEGIITVVDDSHGVGAFGDSGRGTEEFTNSRADILIGTLGKAFGVNGGYVASNAGVIAYLRETCPFYIYSNPVTPGEAAAALKSLEIVDSEQGRQRLAHLRVLTKKLRDGLETLGLETLPGEHPIVPLMVRDTQQTTALVRHLFDHNILVTGLNYPVVPKGDEEIRLQVSAGHTAKDIDYLMDVLAARE